MKKIYKFLLSTCLLSTMNAFGMDESSVGDNDNMNTQTVEQRNETKHQQNWWEEKEPTTLKLKKIIPEPENLQDIATRRVMRDYIKHEVRNKPESHWTKTTNLVRDSLDSIVFLTSVQLGYEQKAEIKSFDTSKYSISDTKFLNLWKCQTEAQINGIVYMNLMRELTGFLPTLKTSLANVKHDLEAMSDDPEYRKEVSQSIRDVEIYVKDLGIEKLLNESKRADYRHKTGVTNDVLCYSQYTGSGILFVKQMKRLSKKGNYELASFTTIKNFEPGKITLAVNLPDEIPYDLNLITAVNNDSEWDGINEIDLYETDAGNVPENGDKRHDHNGLDNGAEKDSSDPHRKGISDNDETQSLDPESDSRTYGIKTDKEPSEIRCTGEQTAGKHSIVLKSNSGDNEGQDHGSIGDIDKENNKTVEVNEEPVDEKYTTDASPSSPTGSAHDNSMEDNESVGNLVGKDGTRTSSEELTPEEGTSGYGVGKPERSIRVGSNDNDTETQTAPSDVGSNTTKIQNKSILEDE